MTRSLGRLALAGCLALAASARGTALAETRAEGDEPKPSAPFLFRSWTTEDGLPHNAVNAIAQTSDGYLWLGTDSGLGRFDGVRCRVFGLSDGLSSLQITALLADRRGVLWIGTYGGGLSRLAQGRIETITTREGLAGDTIIALLEDADGAIWIGTGTGLSRWHEGKLTTVTAEPAAQVYVRALGQDRQGTLWVASLHQGLLRLEDGKLVHVAGPPDISDGAWYSLLADRDGRLWAGLRGGAILCQKETGWTRYGTNQGVPLGYITSLAQTPEGTIWAGSLDEGLLFLKDGTFRTLRQQDGLTDNAVRCVFVDREQNLWAGTRAGGLSRLTTRRLLTRRVPESDQTAG